VLSNIFKTYCHQPFSNLIIILALQLTSSKHAHMHTHTYTYTGKVLPETFADTHKVGITKAKSEAARLVSIWRYLSLNLARTLSCTRSLTNSFLACSCAQATTLLALSRALSVVLFPSSSLPRVPLPLDRYMCSPRKECERLTS